MSDFIRNCQSKVPEGSVQFSSVLSCVQIFATLWTVAHQGSLSFTNSWSLLKLMSIKLVMPSNHFILCHPLLLLPSILPRIRIFSNDSVICIRWPKYCSFSFNISPANEYSGLISFRMDWLELLAVQETFKSLLQHPGLISFRMDWLELLAVQETLKSLLQHHSSKASILRCSAFFIVQLSDPYMTTGKTIVLTKLIIFGKVMSLLFNILSRLAMAFLPRSKRLLIAWLQ